MPQLDKVTFYLQYSCMIYAFLIFHYFIKHTVLRTIFITLKLRELFYRSLEWFQALGYFLCNILFLETFKIFFLYFKKYNLIISYFFSLFFYKETERILFLETLFFKDSFSYFFKKIFYFKLVSNLSDKLVLKSKVS